MANLPIKSDSINSGSINKEQENIQLAVHQVAAAEMETNEGKCLVELALVELAKDTIENSPETGDLPQTKLINES